MQPLKISTKDSATQTLSTFKPSPRSHKIVNITKANYEVLFTCLYVFILGLLTALSKYKKKNFKKTLVFTHFLFLFDRFCCCCCQLKVNVYSITHCSSDSNFNTDKMQKVVDFCFSCVSLTCSLLLLVPSSTGCSL